MGEDTFTACIYVPGAKSVEIVNDNHRQKLIREDEDWWQLELESFQWVGRYRFLADGFGYLPDPYNSAFEVVDRRYFSVMNVGPRPEVFEEKPMGLFFADAIPGSQEILRQVSRYGPGQEYLVAVLHVVGLHRTFNHVQWMWQDPCNSRIFFENIVLDVEPLSYCAFPYHTIKNFGRWRVSAYLNGRFCGSASVDVAPLTYHAFGQTVNWRHHLQTVGDR
jgi:hypothetical protein